MMNIRGAETMDLVVAADGIGEVKIDLGNSPGWIEKYRDLLMAPKKTLTLVPKPGYADVYPPAVIRRFNNLGAWDETISKVYVRRITRRNDDGDVVVYEIKLRFYKLTCLDDEYGNPYTTWVYPNGTIESSDMEDPLFVEPMMEAAEKTFFELLEREAEDWLS